VDAVLIAVGAVLPPLHPLRVLPLVFIGEEIAVLTLGTFKNDLVSGHLGLVSVLGSQVSGLKSGPTRDL
jgi:hypothetical protein